MVMSLSAIAIDAEVKPELYTSVVETTPSFRKVCPSPVVVLPHPTKIYCVWLCFPCIP